MSPAQAGIGDRVARRVARAVIALPPDPVMRAQVVAAKIKAITGCQCGDDTCWTGGAR